MKLRPHSLCLLLLAAAASTMLTLAHAGGPRLEGAKPPPPTDRLIVKYRAGSPGAATADANMLAPLQAIANQGGVQFRVSRRTASGAMVLKLDRRLGAAQAAALSRALAASDATIEYAEPDSIMKPQFVPNDTEYSKQWHYFEPAGGVNLPAAWDKSTGVGVRVAVIDTGYRPHADLAANIVGGYDFVSNYNIDGQDYVIYSRDGDGRDPDATDPGDHTVPADCGDDEARNSTWHGTHVAGTIAAVTNNGMGVAGVAFGAKIVPVRVLGACGGYTSDIADGVVWAAGGNVVGVPPNAYPARVLNLSLAGFGPCGATMQSAINTARSLGAVVVVAAGNANTLVEFYKPANCAGVIAVGATVRDGGPAEYSNYGVEVDIAAPGGDTRNNIADGVLSTLNNGTSNPAGDSLGAYFGTSMATPHVAGIAALMLSVNPALTPDEVEERLKASARPFPATCSICPGQLGTGIVDAAAAVATAGGTVAEVENNNTFGTAQAITGMPVLVNGRIASFTDTDFYRVTLGAGKRLTATLTPPASAGYNLFFYDANGTLITSTFSNTVGGERTASFKNKGSSSTYIVVQVKYFSGGPGDYTLKLQSQ